MWLPKIVYESIPFYWLGIGVIGLGAAFYIDAWFWPEILALAGVIAIVIGLTLLLRRRGYRSSRSRTDFGG
jgi:membrane-bound ClpP family serine protease